MNAVGCCLWCGDELREVVTPTGEWHRLTCDGCGWQTSVARDAEATRA